LRDREIKRWIIGCVRMMVRYCSRRPQDTELRERLRVLAHERRRFGYRRLHVLLRREGFIVNHKRLFRIYRVVRRGAAASGPWAHERPWRFRNGRMTAGRSTSLPISSSMAAACVSSSWSTIARASLALLADTRSPASGSLASSIGSSMSAASPRRS
jgi:transposase InsO family protein